MGDLIYLSPSRIDSFNSCSFYYACTYLYKIHDDVHPNTKKGSIVHAILEVLLSEKRRDLVKKILDKKDIYIHRPFFRFVTSYCKKLRLDAIYYEEINQLVMVGLKNDFYGPKGAKCISELEFKEKIDCDGLTFGIKGIIDKLFIIEKKKEKYAYLVDYKTDSKEWLQDKKDLNMQYLMYTLVIRKMFPDIKLSNINFKFIFLRFPDNPILVMPEVNEEQLHGAAIYFHEVSKAINSFTKEDANSNFAADGGWPAKEEGFCKLLKCGYAKKKGQLKKDGSPMYYCAMKFPFEYYVKFKDGKIEKTSLFLEDLGEGEIKKYKYSGCPKWNSS